MVNAYPRESIEFQPVTVMRDGDPVTEGLTFAIVADGERPTTFTEAEQLGGQFGVMVSGLEPGTYRIFAQMTSFPETPVIDCGYFYVT